MTRLSEAQKRKAAQEAYTRGVSQGKISRNTSFDYYYANDVLTDILYLSIIEDLIQDNNDSSSYDDNSSSSYEDNSSSYDSSSSDSSSYDSGSSDSGSYDGGGGGE